MTKERKGKRKQREEEPGLALCPRHKILLGVGLAGLNVLLLFHNLDAFEKPGAHLEPDLEPKLVPMLEPAHTTLATTTQPSVRLRGARPGKTVAELVAAALTRNLSRPGESHIVHADFRAAGTSW